MYGTIHVYDTIYVTVHDIVHIDGRWRGIDRWCGIDWWGVTILLGKNSYVLLMVTYISGRKISRTVHASYKIIFNQTASLFNPGQTVLLFIHVVKPLTVDWWRGEILSVQTVFNPMSTIYSMYL